MRVATADPVLSIDEFSIYLKIPKSTLCKPAQGESLPGQKIGKHWWFHLDAIYDWLKRTNMPKTPPG